MDLLKRLPGSVRHDAPGLEWAILRRLPAVLLWGTAIPLGLAALAWLAAPAAVPGVEDARWLLQVYQLVGLVVLHWTLVLTVAIGCVVVHVMKGPAFVADAYDLPEREPPPDRPR